MEDGIEKPEGGAAEARMLFKRFLAERWFGGPDFESWVVQQGELQADLRRLRDGWLAELRDPDSPVPSLEREPGARSAASFAPGEVLGGFRLVERIGAGASGEVWRAVELALGRPVALKLLRPDLVLNPRANERFRREALAGARIRHAGVVAVYSIGRAQGQPFIAQEYIEGGRTLATWIREEGERGPRTPAHFRQAAEWIAQAAEALDAAHAQGIFHRDIKPQNLLLTPDGRVKVADFGLAHLAGEFPISQLGDVLGTVPYMSPSQLRGEVDRLDARSDVFSLGATLYELVTLERAFGGKSLAEIAYRVQRVDPPAPRRRQPRMSVDLDTIIRRTLEKDAADRYATMGELAAELRRFLRGEPLLARSSSLRGRLRKWTRRHPTAAVSSCVACVASVALAWQAWDRDQREDQRVAAQLHALEARAQLAIELGDIDEAARLVADGDELAGENPTGHLILAAGYARLERHPDWTREIELAREHGFVPDPQRLRSGIEHGAYALYLQSQRDFALYPEAERHIARALELDPGLYAFELTRYQLRVAIGDHTGAGAALAAFQSHIPSGEFLYQKIEVLRLEHEGEPAHALELLDSLVVNRTPSQLAELCWPRNAGRLCVQVGDFERAEALLLQAVAADPQDCFSRDNLAIVYQKRLEDGDPSPELIDRARANAEDARACSASLPNPNYVLAYVALWELGKAGASDVRAHPSWKSAREALDRLHALGAGDTETTRKLEAHLLMLEVLPPYERGERAPLVELLSRGHELAPDDLQSTALLGECLYWAGEPLRGLEVLERGLEVWDGLPPELQRDPHWLGMMLVWILANAGEASDRAAFERARARLEQQLDDGVAFPREELLNAALFLATAPEELRACDLAWHLIDRHELDAAFEGTAVDADVRDMLADIERACP